MRARTALVAAVAIALAATTPAVAAARPAPRKLCNLLTDQKDDGEWDADLGTGVVKSGALDIVSADIATGRTEMVAVLRIADMSQANDHWRQALSYEWGLGATGTGTRYSFSLRRGLGPTPSDVWEVRVGDLTLPPAKINGKIEGNTIVWRIQRKDVPALGRAKLYWTDFGAITKALSSSADQAPNSTAKYPDKSASCVTAR